MSELKIGGLFNQSRGLRCFYYYLKAEGIYDCQQQQQQQQQKVNVYFKFTLKCPQVLLSTHYGNYDCKLINI